METFIGGSCVIHYDPDLIGNVVIEKNMSNTESLTSGKIEILARDILDFVSEAYVKPKLIKNIRGTEAPDILLSQINPIE